MLILIDIITIIVTSHQLTHINMPYLVYNVFTDDHVVLYRLIGLGTSIIQSVTLAQMHLNKHDINGNVTLHGHPFEKGARINVSLMSSRKEVEKRWGDYTRDLLHGYVIEKVNSNESIRDKAYKMAWV